MISNIFFRNGSNISNTEWILVWVSLKNAHLKGFNDPRTQQDPLFDIEVTGELNISQIFKGNHFKIFLNHFKIRVTVIIVPDFRYLNGQAMYNVLK